MPEVLNQVCDRQDKKWFRGFIDQTITRTELCLLTVLESLLQYNVQSSVYFIGLIPRLAVPRARLWPHFGKTSRFELQLQHYFLSFGSVTALSSNEMELSFDDEAVGAPPVDQICWLPQLRQVWATQAAHIGAGTLELDLESGLLPH